MATERDPIGALLKILTGAFENFAPAFRFLNFYPENDEEWQKLPQNVALLLMARGVLGGHMGAPSFKERTEKGENVYVGDEMRTAFALQFYHNVEVSQYSIITRLNVLFQREGGSSISVPPSPKASWVLNGWDQGSSFRTIRRGERLVTASLTLNDPIVTKDKATLVKGHKIQGEVGEKVRAVANLGFGNERD